MLKNWRIMLSIDRTFRVVRHRLDISWLAQLGDLADVSCSAHSWSMQHILGCKAGELRLHSKRRDHGRIGEVMGFVLVGGQRCSATKWSTC